MNILFIYRGAIIPTRGGIQRVTNVLADYFESKGHKVLYLTGKNENDDEREINKKRQFFFPNNTDVLAKENFSYFKVFLADNKIDILINQNGMDPVLSSLAYTAKDCNVKLVSCIHNSLLSSITNFSSAYASRAKKYNLGWILPITDFSIIKKGILYLYKNKYKKHYKKLCEISDSVVLLSDNFKSELDFFVENLSKDNIIAISNPTSFKKEKVDLVLKKKQLLYVGRVGTSQKRVDLLLLIWRKVFKNNPDWSLIIVGDGPELPKLKNEAKILKLERIKFEGFKNPKQYYIDASLFCMTSSFEGFGIVLVEAMQYGVIPFAFKSYLSVTDIIDDNTNGFLIKPFSIEQYADSLNKLMNNESLRNKVSKSAIEKAGIFSINTIGESWIHLFKGLKNYE
ncbi:glycosyltransferase [Lutibacter sp. TH_r2]|uniref:glycosyltransferase n=1 Tax=Lutibacter sp. TH_r2 TaxID=3082083 RepID=UPI002954A66C|nr:glycosyltransferase [Lutibacter sp. TH_r2]MDV7187798.1 glycosyltransferase [Lutibacter sp. TH_r2]